MLLVRTKIGFSKIQGIGLFADQFIPKGTMVQRFIPGIDVEINEGELERLAVSARKQILHYAYRHKKTGNYILCSDDARFLNHSENPSLIGDSSGEEIDIAARDIQSGEELTVNYKDFDVDWDDKLSEADKGKQ